MFVIAVLPWALDNARAGYFMLYILYIYIIIKYVALILLNCEYIIYRGHLPVI